MKSVFGRLWDEKMLQILSDARDFIAAGWTQGSYYRTVDGQQCYCAIGAISMAARGVPTASAWNGAERDAREYIANFIPGEIFLSAYNDAKGRTKEEVLEVFDNAIASLEGVPNGNGS